MAKSAIDIAEALKRLSALTIFELRDEWRRLHRAPPPMRLSRDLLIRGITYKLQERACGGLSKGVARKLERLNLNAEASDARKPAPPISLKAGTRHHPGFAVDRGDPTPGRFKTPRQGETLADRIDRQGRGLDDAEGGVGQ